MKYASLSPRWRINWPATGALAMVDHTSTTGGSGGAAQELGMDTGLTFGRICSFLGNSSNILMERILPGHTRDLLPMDIFADELKGTEIWWRKKTCTVASMIMTSTSTDTASGMITPSLRGRELWMAILIFSMNLKNLEEIVRWKKNIGPRRFGDIMGFFQ